MSLIPPWTITVEAPRVQRSKRAAIWSVRSPKTPQFAADDIATAQSACGPAASNNNLQDDTKAAGDTTKDGDYKGPQSAVVPNRFMRGIYLNKAFG